MIYRIVLGTSTVIDSKTQAVPLSRDHTPYLPDESARCTASGSIILSFSLIDPSTAPGDEDDDVEDPPRVWASGGSYPGMEFTRSLGDAVAEGLGVFAKPENERVATGSGCIMTIARRRMPIMTTWQWSSYSSTILTRAVVAATPNMLLRPIGGRRPSQNGRIARSPNA